jgi:hypothetical protein
MNSLSIEDIRKFASRRGAHKEDVEYFLNTVGQAGTEEGALMNLYYDARLYSWNITTIWAIEAGIKSAYNEGADVVAHVVEKAIETPLPGGAYSLWPQMSYKAQAEVSSLVS